MGRFIVVVAALGATMTMRMGIHITGLAALAVQAAAGKALLMEQMPHLARQILAVVAAVVFTTQHHLRADGHLVLAALVSWLSVITGLKRKAVCKMTVAEYVDVPKDVIMIGAESDLDNLPAGIPIGTIAILAGESKKWQLDFDGEWVAFS